MTMKKYFYQLIILLRTSFHYRFNTVVELLFSNMDLLITVLFWMLIYKSAGTGRLQTYTAADMVIYYLANSVLRRFNLTNSSWEYVSSIKNGTLSAKLLKPCRIGGMIYVRNLALAVTGMLPAALFILAAAMTITAKTRSAVLGASLPFILLFLPAFLPDLSGITKMLGLLPDQLLQLPFGLNTFSLYQIGKTIVPAVPILFLVYSVLSVLLLPAAWQIYRQTGMRQPACRRSAACRS